MSPFVLFVCWLYLAPFYAVAWVLDRLRDGVTVLGHVAVTLGMPRVAIEMLGIAISLLRAAKKVREFPEGDQS